MDGLVGLLILAGLGVTGYYADDLFKMLDDDSPPVFLTGLFGLGAGVMLVLIFLGEVFGKLDGPDTWGNLGGILAICGIGVGVCLWYRMSDVGGSDPPRRGGGEGTGYSGRSSGDGGWSGDGGDGGDGGGGDGGG
ncbi:hypothetical protein [Marinitenerispora sediminis]|uniref:Uncharacterized protein n=1 Tax=Marinitenerispora sediminis TaxID=1931232 RepID=A0A368T7A2_9ACTN|nr:hypothetical protein [Marinitenerispora sediminis]RCV50654.1 hypothetical protein DEF28_17530 [Marinitenerispora sediminis]RCV56204.1 hypothetical protein DEF23_12995 [Marinitenerispora sediminis]RCV59435.1 hypothetical protein DEF24_09665 [Marinitenerispora sediminis]